MVYKRRRTFTCFENLPKELRDYIWQLAIQNDKNEAEIHFFSTRAFGNMETYKVSGDIHNYGLPSLIESCAEISAPSWRSDGGPEDWASRRNPSGYLLDSGLWLACAESHDTMVRNMEKEERDTSACPMAVKVPANRSLWRRYLVTRLDRDLHVFQLPTYKMLSLSVGILEDFMDNHPLGIGTMYSVGIEYDPRWALAFAEEDADYSPKIKMSDRKTDPHSRLLWEMANPSKKDSLTPWLWLVDHRVLKPKAGVSFAELGKNRQTFRGKGWRYFEVDRDDVGERWEVADGFKSWQNPYEFAFFVTSHPDMKDWLDGENRYLDDDYYKVDSVNCRVAACVKDE